MLAHFDGLKPYPPSNLFFYKVGRVVRYIPSDRLATYRGQNAELGQTSSSKYLKLSQLRIILSYEQRVIEHVMEPIPEWPKTTEIQAPFTLVKVMGSENESECKCVPMETLAVGVRCAPLPKAAREPFIVIVGLGRAIHSMHATSATRHRIYS
jgi:hypothetical protein